MRVGRTPPRQLSTRAMLSTRASAPAAPSRSLAPPCPCQPPPPRASRGDAHAAQAAHAIILPAAAAHSYPAPIHLSPTRILAAHPTHMPLLSIVCPPFGAVHGKPIFPGQSTMNQLEKIMELTGMPTEATTANISKVGGAPNRSGVRPKSRARAAHAQALCSSHAPRIRGLTEG